MNRSVRIIATAAAAAAIVACAAGSPSLAQTRPGKASATGKAGTPTTPAEVGDSRVDAITDAVLDGLTEIADGHWHKGEYCHIVNLTRIIVAGQPGNLDLYANAGWLLWSMNRDAEAVALYEQGLKANPNSFFMYDELGQYYYSRKKDWPAAIKYYEQAVKFDDAQFFTFHQLAHAYERTGQLGKALKVWESVVAKEGPGPAQGNIARLRRKMNLPAASRI